MIEAQIYLAFISALITTCCSDPQPCTTKTFQANICKPKGDPFFKKELPGYDDHYLVYDGPCFPFNGKPYCFIGYKNHVRICNCLIPSCGCDSFLSTSSTNSTTTTQTTTTSFTTSGSADEVQGDTIPVLRFADDNYKESTSAACHSPPTPVSNCSKYNVYCSASLKNSACPDMYCPLDISSGCGDVCFHGLSEEDAKIILDLHNELRRKVAKGLETESFGSTKGQPPASNMRELQWDPELATIAQSWANQCEFGHDLNRKEPSNPSGWVGQNAALHGTPIFFPTKELVTLTKGWYDEVACFHPDRISPWRPKEASTCPDGPNGNPQTGHYTQLVWADTNRLGCGYIKFKKPDSSYFKEILICNYAPGGNVIGSQVYSINYASSNSCPYGTYLENGLCKES